MPALRKPEFHELLLTRVRLLTDDAVGLTFLVPEELAGHYSFVPGQYLTLRATVNGVDVRRCYSISSGIDENRRLEVGIKAVEGGLFSNYACGLSAGTTLQVMTPQGNFVAPIGGTHHYLLVAAGSGITPCLSIIKSVLKREPESRATLLLGNRTVASIMFAEDLKALKDRYVERFSVVHMLSDERLDGEIFSGRIDAGKIESLASAGMLGSADWDAAFCCGPETMLDAIEPALASIGVPAAQIHRELFLTQTTPNTTSVQSGNAAPESGAGNQASPTTSDVVTVNIRIDGSDKHIELNGQQETVLQAANRAGLDLPFSCTGGMCCTCRCKMLEGKVTMDANFSLAKWEVEAGFILACQARAESDHLTLDFDAT